MKTHRRDAGFSLSALIFFATAASILAAAAVPAYQMQAKRERERELIFRGEEYTRAIQKYQRKFGVYPGSIDQLVQTNGLRFVRHAYKDPITGKDFRLIRINPDGSLSGSKVFTQNVNNPQSLFGNTQTFGQQPGAQQQQPGTPQQQQQQPGTPQQQQQQPGAPQQQMQQQLQDIQQQRGQQGLSQGLQPLAPLGQQSQQQFQQFGQRQGQPGGLGSFVGTPIGNAGGTPVASGGLIGVASDSDEKSIMVYNQRQKYNEWEFLAIFGQAGQQPQRGQQPVQPGQGPTGPGQIVPPGLGPGSQFPGAGPQFPGAGPQFPGTGPQFPQPGLAPFGPAPGRGGQQPFGFGNLGNPAIPPVQPGSNPPGKLP